MHSAPGLDYAMRTAVSIERCMRWESDYYYYYKNTAEQWSLQYSDSISQLAALLYTCIPAKLLRIIEEMSAGLYSKKIKIIAFRYSILGILQISFRFYIYFRSLNMFPLFHFDIFHDVFFLCWSYGALDFDGKL